MACDVNKGLTASQRLRVKPENSQPCDKIVVL